MLYITNATWIHINDASDSTISEITFALIEAEISIIKSEATSADSQVWVVAASEAQVVAAIKDVCSDWGFASEKSSEDEKGEDSGQDVDS